MPDTLIVYISVGSATEQGSYAFDVVPQIDRQTKYKDNSSSISHTSSSSCSSSETTCPRDLHKYKNNTMVVAYDPEKPPFQNNKAAIQGSSIGSIFEIHCWYATPERVEQEQRELDEAWTTVNSLTSAPMADPHVETLLQSLNIHPQDDVVLWTIIRPSHRPLKYVFVRNSKVAQFLKSEYYLMIESEQDIFAKGRVFFAIEPYMVRANYDAIWRALNVNQNRIIDHVWFVTSDAHGHVSIKY